MMIYIYNKWLQYVLVDKSNYWLEWWCYTVINHVNDSTKQYMHNPMYRVWNGENNRMFKTRKVGHIEESDFSKFKALYQKK